jgi:DNA-binding response OmpR family regulator
LGEGHDDQGARGAVAIVFLSDHAAEAGPIGQALRAAGHTTIEVPQSMLVARVAVQHPHVILLDADSEGALDVVARVRELPAADDIHVLFLARAGGTIATPEEAIAKAGSGLFVRPVDVASLVNRVSSLVRGAAASVAPAPAKKAPSLPPASMRAAASQSPPIPTEPPETEAEVPPRAIGLGPPVSAELRELLNEAEQRIQLPISEGPTAPSPEEEIEAVLPAELLAALDEPLEEGDDDDEMAPPPTRAHPSLAHHGLTPAQGTPHPSPVTGAEGSSPPPAEGQAGTQAGPAGAGISTTGGSEARSDAAHTPPLPSEEGLAARSMESGFPAVLGPGDTLRVVGRAIASRTTGSLCVASPDAELRVVLREGDVVTCASTAAEETLLAFLGKRGDLPRETVRRLVPKFPAFGRHAGAALVARGYLSQEQMWPTLRAHAEWVLARMLQTSSAHLAVERQPAGRLAGEPSVFGGSTGAEVFVEVVRRIVAPAEAIERLGGLGSRIGAGPAAQLLVECALGEADTERIRTAAGRTLRNLIDDVPEGDTATVVFALTHLGVLDVMRSVGDGSEADEEGSHGTAAIDADAIREHVRARMELVQDGDYFALLGVARDATGYEVRRAFLELRRAFDPSRVLTREVADLAEDVRKITVVLEEAYEILKDSARRERYRHAIELTP